MNITEHPTEHLPFPPTFTLEVSLNELKVLERAVLKVTNRDVGEVLETTYIGHVEEVRQPLYEALEGTAKAHRIGDYERTWK